MATFDTLAPQVINRLSTDLGLTQQQAAGIVGQLAHESDGLQAINEYKPVVPGSRGGFGWAQWTGPRRRDFESWAEQNKMDVSTPDANYGFLLHELQNTPESRVLESIKGAKDAQSAGRIFTDQFLRPGTPLHEQRASWTDRAMNLMIPAAQAGTLPQGGMQAKIQAARDAGYSDDEIMGHVSQMPDFSTKLQQARDAGYSDDEVFGHLGLSMGDTKPATGDPIRVDITHEQPVQQDQMQQQPDPMQQQQSSGGGILSGIGMGLRDPIDAGAQMLRRAVPESVGQAVDQFGNMLSNAGFPIKSSEGAEGVDSLINQANTDYETARSQAGREGIDWARLGGNIAGMAPVAYATPQALAAGIGRVGAGAIQGAAFGALQPVVGESAQEGFGKSKAIQAGVGGVMGGALPAAARVLAPAASRATSAAQRLAGEGVNLTPGQALGGAMMRLEDRAMSVPIVGDAIRSARTRGNESLNRAVYNRVLSPIGEKTNKVGREAVNEARSKISKAYDDVLDQVTFTPDGEFAQSISNLRNMAQSLPNKERKAFEGVLQREVLDPISKGRSIDGRAFKDIETQLGNEAKRFSRSTDAYQQDVGNAIGELQKSLRENLVRMNPPHAERLRNVNESFANFVRLENAAGRIGAQDGIFTPQQLASAIRQTDRSTRKGAYSRGDALMQDLSDAAQSRMSATIPDSGTAGRLAQMGVGGGIGAGLMTNPGATMMGLGALGAASVPYLPGVSRAATGAILNRPASAKALADALAKLPPGALGALAGLAQ